MFDLASVVHLPNAPLLDLCRQMYDIDDRKVYLAPLPLYDGVHPTGTPSRLGARRRFGFGDDDRVVLQFGALREQKGVDRVLDAVARAQQVDPSMRLLLAGPVVDAEHEYGRAMIDAANELPGSVVVEGFVPDRFVGTVLRAADLNVCGYRWSRSSGVLVLSLGFDVPVLGPDEPDFMALAERTDMVTTFDNRDANALTEHLVAWASTPRRSTVLDQQLREELDPIRFSRRFAEAITTRVNADTKMSGSSGVRSAST